MLLLPAAGGPSSTTSSGCISGPPSSRRRSAAACERETNSAMALSFVRMCTQTQRMGYCVSSRALRTQRCLVCARPSLFTKARVRCSERLPPRLAARPANSSLQLQCGVKSRPTCCLSSTEGRPSTPSRGRRVSPASSCPPGAATLAETHSSPSSSRRMTGSPGWSQSRSSGSSQPPSLAATVQATSCSVRRLPSPRRSRSSPAASSRASTRA
mmetsp:Transcript_66698/g.214886  ORF Transcript_66698/g.214886 Transcript_66698/m.214886 type:complete len:213 (-) Transcript_66698:87-725(-)